MEFKQGKEEESKDTRGRDEEGERKKKRKAKLQKRSKGKQVATLMLQTAFQKIVVSL